jgi:hypothetical protein
MAVIPSRDANHWSKHDIRQEQHNKYQEPGKSLQQQLHHRKEPGFSSGKIPTFSKIHFYRGQPVILLERLRRLTSATISSAIFSSKVLRRR